MIMVYRSLDFTLALLEKVASNEVGMNMERAVEESYNQTLKPWHGWISSAAYKVTSHFYTILFVIVQADR